MPLGLPHSVFLSWDVDDQDKALTWQLEQALTCQRCHTRKDEWDPEQGGDRNAYVADVTRCSGCEVLDQAQRDLATMEDTHGVKIGLVPLPDDDDEGPAL